MALQFADKDLVLRLDKYLEDNGLTRQGRSGLIGNLYAESGVRLDNLQNSYEKKWASYGVTEASYFEAVDNGTWKDPINGMSFVFDKAGAGLAQWTSSGRKQGWLDYAHELNESLISENVEFGWLMKELTLKYKNVLAMLRDPNATIGDCAEAVVLKFEVPGSVLGDADTKQKTINTRIGYANEVYDFLFNVGKEAKEQKNMSASIDFDLRVCLLTKNDCYKANKKMAPEGIIVHSTGANNPSLKRYVQPNDGTLGKNTYNNSWNNSGISKCVHAFIGKDKNGLIRTYQTLPFNVCCWGIGRGSKGSYNYPASTKYPNDRAYLQFEICEDGLTNEAYFNSVMEEAQKFCAYLMSLYPNIKLENVISHNEGYKRGMGSSHSDIDHWLKKFGKDMGWFRSCVNNLLKANTVAVEEPKTEEKTEEKTETENTTKVKVSEATKIFTDTNTKADPGVYTITETYNGMGRLKSGKGWIPLANTNNV